MHFVRPSIIALAIIPAAFTAPLLEKRALSQNDADTLHLALFLEHVEQAFYSGGYAAFTDAQFEAAGFPPGFRENINVIAQQEATHAATITQVLEENGLAGFGSCSYSFPYNSPQSFADLSNMITSVGIGAYIGGASELVDNTDLLTTAATILTNEARHDAYIRTGLTASPFPAPFDTPLTALFAYSLASMFVVSCPPEANLGLIALPKLTLTSPMPPVNLQPPTPAGTVLTFSWDPSTFFVSVDPNAPLYIAMINQAGPPIFQEVTKTSSSTGTVPVPSGAAGVAFAVLSTFSGGLTETQLSQFGTLAGPAEVVLS